MVGDDAINRVMSRLRRVAEWAGGGVRVETITKVGYRLITPSFPGASASTAQLASALGRVDIALSLLRPLFFDARFPDPAIAGGRHAPQLEDRFTAFLFYPSMARARGDPRFDAMMREIGLDRFWRESGMPPDYRRA